MEFPQNLKTELPYDPENPFVDVYVKELESGSWKDAGTIMFIAASFISAKMWKLPKFPLTDEWIKKMWYMHTIECYGDFKKENPEIPDNTDEPWEHYSMSNKSVIERQILHVY